MWGQLSPPIIIRRPMNFGFDLDEVIAKTAHMAVGHFNDVYACNYGIELFKSFQFKDNTYSEDPEEQSAAVETLVWAVFDEKMMDSVEPYEDAVRVINDLKRQGHKIFVITKRPKEHTGMTSRWLHRHKISFDKLVLTGLEDKGSFAKRLQLDAFVDDLEENLYDMYKAKRRWNKGLILMTRPWNEDDVIDGSKFSRANNWVDVRKYLSIGNRLK